MENQENSTISMLNEMNQTINQMNQMINQMNQTISILSKNQDLLFEQNKALDKKIDDKFNYLDNKIDALEIKFDDKFVALEKKVDNNSANIVKILNTVSKMEKDITDLRDDVETIYSLEKDSRKQLKRLL